MPSQPAKIGKYEILSQLGRGGMGVVYKAHDPVIDRVVAIKTILISGDEEEARDLVERLHMEARSAGRLHHTNIVTVFDYGDQDQLSYIVMEYVEGVNLARLIEERRPIALASKLRILIQVAQGLAYAHEHSVIHRDMKPSNVCVTAKGIAKILDFGLARFDDTKLTKTGYMAGTIAYMSPERLSGESGIKDDIFALGAIAYEFLTYVRAFPGSSAPEVMSKIITPEPPRAPSLVAGLPVELDRVIATALAKDVADRYDSAAVFANGLEHLLHSDAVRTFTEPHQPEGESGGDFLDDRRSGSVYVGPSSAKLDSSPPATMQTLKEDAPTIAMAPATSVATQIQGAATDRGVAIAPVAAATQVIASASPRRGGMPVAAIVILVVAAAGVWLARRTPSTVPPPVVSNSQAPLPVSPKPVASDLVEKTELQLATARTLSDELGRRSLNHQEMMRFSEAKARMTIAEKKIRENDYESGARLISGSLSALEAVMSANSTRSQQPGERVPDKHPAGKPPMVRTASAGPPPIKSAVAAPRPIAVTTVPETRPAPAPVPVPVPVPVQPAPAVQPTAVEPPPRQPTAESPERQVASFIAQLAAAYQAKDVAFFREHAAHFSDQLANAIRNSPSVRVELQIMRTEFADPHHASVHVKRADWFGDANATPATQTLVYRIERGANGWEILSIGRE